MLRRRQPTTRRHLVHVGVHKTGSTWLQQDVFPRAEGLVYASASRTFVDLVNDLRTAPDESFAPDAFRAAVDAHEARGERLIVSNESLAGDLWDGTGTGERRARRLAEAVPDADVLLFTRAQPEMLVAVYAQYVNEGGTCSFERFLAGDYPGPSFHLDALEYDRIVATYRTLFGADRVWVYPYELLRSNPDAFIAQLEARLDTQLSATSRRQVNVSLSPAGLLLLRGWNTLFRRSPFNPAPTVALPGGRRVRNLLQQRIDPLLRRIEPAKLAHGKLDLALIAAERYAESNTRLEQMTGLRLRDLGYPLPVASS